MTFSLIHHPDLCFLFSTVFKLWNTYCVISLSYQDLSNEHARYQELSTEVERLSQKLQKTEAEQKAVTESLSQSEARIESLSRCLKESESLLQVEKQRRSMEADITSSSNADSSNKTHLSQTPTQETSLLDQSPGASKGHDLSVTRDSASGETERQMSEQLTELEKEVCICDWMQVCE